MLLLLPNIELQIYKLNKLQREFVMERLAALACRCQKVCYETKIIFALFWSHTSHSDLTNKCGCFVKALYEITT